MRGRQFQDCIIDQKLAIRIGLEAKHNTIAREIRSRQTDDIGIDPATAGFADHSVAEHISEVGYRALSPREIAREQRLIWTYPPRIDPIDAGRQVDFIVIAVNAQISPVTGERGKTAIGDGIKPPVPERCKVVCSSAFRHQRIRASTLRLSSSQSPKKVSVVRCPFETNSA